MIITIAGTLGSGKSTVAKIISKKLGYKHYSTGHYMREMARKRGITLMDLSKIAQTDESIDKELDMYQKRLGETEDNFIIDARLAFHFIPHSFKVYLKSSEDVSTKRIYKSMKNDPSRFDEGLMHHPEKILKSMRKRRKSEDERYKKYYGVNQEDESHYNIVIDTSNITPEKAVKLILNQIKQVKQP